MPDGPWFLMYWNLHLVLYINEEANLFNCRNENNGDQDELLRYFQDGIKIFLRGTEVRALCCRSWAQEKLSIVKTEMFCNKNVIFVFLVWVQEEEITKSQHIISSVYWQKSGSVSSSFWDEIILWRCEEQEQST